VVGGGNSAGQAAVYLASYAAQVTMLVAGRRWPRPCPTTWSASWRRRPTSPSATTPRPCRRPRCSSSSGRAPHRLAPRDPPAGPVGVRGHRHDLLADGRPPAGWPPGAAPDAVGDQPARRVRGRRRPPRVDQAGRRRGRGRLGRHPPGPRAPDPSIGNASPGAATWPAAGPPRRRARGRPRRRPPRRAAGRPDAARSVTPRNCQ